MNTRSPRPIPSQSGFKPKQLALLAALAEVKTLRGAADRIHLSQPAATRLLRELEQMLGVRLFDRSTLGLHVTAAGEAMIEHARSLEAGMLNAYREVHDAAAGTVGTVRLGVFGSVDPVFLSRAIAALKQSAPRVHVAIKEAPKEFLLQALRRNVIDAAISRVSVDSGMQWASQEPLYTETFSLVCGRSGLHKRRSATIESLIDMPWVLPTAESLLRQRLSAFCLAKYGRAPQSYVDSESTLGTLALLDATPYPGVLAASIGRYFIKSGQLRLLADRLAGIESSVVLVTRAGEVPRPSLAGLMRALGACC
jgi:DNA-binding transcriptional LysR family regulator